MSAPSCTRSSTCSKVIVYAKLASDRILLIAHLRLQLQLQLQLQLIDGTISVDDVASICCPTRGNCRNKLPYIEILTVTGIAIPTVAGMAIPTVTGIAIPTVTGIGIPTVTGIGIPTVPGIAIPTVTGIAIPTVTGIAIPKVTGIGIPTVSCNQKETVWEDHRCSMQVVSYPMQSACR